jgi:hypothetical protein
VSEPFPTDELIGEIIHTITVEQPIKPFLFPEEGLMFVPAANDLHQKFANGDSERKIHNNTALNAQERAQINEFMQYIARHNIHLGPFVLSSASRFISRARGDIAKAVKLAVHTHEWRAEYFDPPLTDRVTTEIMQMAKRGIVYVAGRDSSLRPLMVVRPDRIPSELHNEKDCNVFIRMLVFWMEYVIRYMMMPGAIENLSVLVDLDHFKMGWNSAKLMKHIYAVLSSHYIGRVYKFYVVNAPYFMNMLMSMVRPLLTDRQQQKICMLSHGSMHPLHDVFAGSQLEKRYGGDRENISRFYPVEMNPGPFQPPLSLGRVSPNYSAIHDAHKVLPKYNNLGSVLLADSDTEGTRPQERLRLSVTDKEFCKMCRRMHG